MRLNVYPKVPLYMVPVILILAVVSIVVKYFRILLED